MWQEIRKERDLLLKQTDYKVLIHYEIGEPVPNDLINYRQSLRDIPQNYDNPKNIVWPQKPDALQTK